MAGTQISFVSGEGFFVVCSSSLTQCSYARIAGVDIGQQIRQLRSGVDVAVGTPGRVIDLINRNCLNLSLVTTSFAPASSTLDWVLGLFYNTNSYKIDPLLSAPLPLKVSRNCHYTVKKCAGRLCSAPSAVLEAKVYATPVLSVTNLMYPTSDVADISKWINSFISTQSGSFVLHMTKL